MLKNHQSTIRNFYKKNRRMPSYSEIMEETGIKSKETVFRLVKKFINQGFLAKDAKGKLIPKKIMPDLKVLGTIEAGFPSPAEEELLDTMTLDEYLIHNREATFMLKVSGDSMNDAGIKAGDMVLVERNREPQNGDIVIADIDNQWTMKYFQKDGKKITLVPANKKYQPFEPKNELRIAAVVTTVIRKYK
jgi:SOS regulatory protein LexA